MKKELRAIIKTQKTKLLSSEKDMRAVYDLMFSLGDRVFSEYDDGFRIKKYTFADVKSMIEHVADSLYTKIGAKHEFIGLESENSIEWIVAFWAILKSGNKPYLINCRHPKGLSDSVIKRLSVKYVLGIKPGELDAEYINIPSLMGEAEQQVPMDEFENTFAISTSATTLKETVCFYDGEAVAAQLFSTEAILSANKNITSSCKGKIKILAFLPFYHVFGLFAVHFWFSFFGRTLVFLRDYSPDVILKTVRKQEVTHIFAVPMLWHTVEDKIKKDLAADEKKKKKFEKALKLNLKLQNICPSLGRKLSLRHMREATEKIFGESVMFCITGGSYIRNSALYFLNGIGYPLYNGFGMTEAGITSVELRGKPKYRLEGSIGRPIASVEYKITNDGTLAIRGSSLCRRTETNGVYEDINGWIDTNDIAEEKDGHYYILGRKGDSVIGENGENINPDIIEQYFDIPEARAYTVIGLGEGESEELTMIIEVSKYLPQGKLKTAIDRIYKTNEGIPSASRIRKFFITNESLISETAIKISRSYIKRAVSEGKINLIPFSDASSAVSGNTDGINTEISEKIRSIISDVLGIPKEEISNDKHIIFDLGATSLHYFAIIAAISKEFSVSEYSEKENYRYTVRELSEYIERHI